MKTIKFTLMALLVAAVMPIVSCGSSKAEQEAEPIIGFWEIVEGGDVDGYSRQMIMHFTEYNICHKIVLSDVSSVDNSYREGRVERTYEYKIEGDAITIGGGRYEFTISDDMLEVGPATFKKVSKNEMKKRCKNTEWKECDDF